MPRERLGVRGNTVEAICVLGGNELARRTDILPEKLGFQLVCEVAEWDISKAQSRSPVDHSALRCYTKHKH